MAIEEWRDIPGFEGRYQASTLGNVRSLRFRNNHTDRTRAVPMVLKAQVTPNGYRWLHLGANPYKWYQVRVLVLETFVGPRPRGHQVAHWNGIKTDDRLSNLRWATAEENAADKVRHGTVPIGERHKGAKLTEAQIHEIRDLLRQGVPQRKIATDFGVSQTPISCIALGRTWKHVPVMGIEP